MNTRLILAVLALGVLSARAGNMIVNGDFEAGITGFESDYTYAPENMLAAGTYCVTNNPNNVHPYWDTFGDHTTGAGWMLVANGDDNKENAVWRQTVSVAAHTSYLFGAWAASAHAASPGRFILSINGVQQGNIVELPSTTGLWLNYAVVWDSQEDTSALLEVRVLSTELYGNDFVLDDLSFRAVNADAAPRLAIRTISAGAEVELSWPSAAGQTYQLQWALEIEKAQWFALGPPTVGTGGTMSVTEAVVADGRRFYRALAVD